MNYKQTIGYLFSQLPMFHRIGPPAYKANLNNTLALSEYFNHPQRDFPSIHIAGTNGKGSVANMLAAIFSQQGYKTGLATSPHLKDFRERIRINGHMIPRAYVAKFVTEHKHVFEKIKPSFFELTIALTFKYFSDQKVDIAIIETGLGGRLDSTNIITPEVSVITNIGLDHTNLLGDTIEKIAGEKAGIIKNAIPVVIGKRQSEIHHVFEEKSRQTNSPLYIASDKYHLQNSRQLTLNKRALQEISYMADGKSIQIKSDLLGGCQPENLATVLQVVDVINSAGKFKIEKKNILESISNVSSLTGLMGRWQLLGKRPVIIADTAHNKDGIRLVVNQLHSLNYNKLRMVIGMADDKDVDSVLALLPADADYYFCRPDVPRGLGADVLMQKAIEIGINGRVFESVGQALLQAKSEAAGKDVIFVGGSTFVVAEVV